jgi:predicted site-specific integrase-resolvase
MPARSTVEVAEIVEVSWDTLNRWIRAKKFPVPPVKLVGRVRVRLWTEEQIEAVRVYKKNHYKGKGVRRKRKKQTD